MSNVKCKMFSHFRNSLVSSHFYTIISHFICLKGFKTNIHHSWWSNHTGRQITADHFTARKQFYQMFISSSSKFINSPSTNYSITYSCNNRILYEMMCCHLTSTEDLCNDSPLAQNTSYVNTGSVPVPTSSFCTSNYWLILHDLLFMNFFL